MNMNNLPYDELLDIWLLSGGGRESFDPNLVQFLKWVGNANPRSVTVAFEDWMDLRFTTQRPLDAFPRWDEYLGDLASLGEIGDGPEDR